MSVSGADNGAAGKEFDGPNEQSYTCSKQDLYGRKFHPGIVAPVGGFTNDADCRLFFGLIQIGIRAAREVGAI